MRYGIITISFIFLSLFFIYCNAQNARKYMRHIDQSDGLLHNNILSITQDGKGFIWILSSNGLQRYDGVRFVNYPYEVNNSAGINYTNSCKLIADKKSNRLWIINEKIEILDLKKNVFTVYDDNQLMKNPFFGFEPYKDSTGNTWLAGNFGVFRPKVGTGKMNTAYLYASSNTNNNSDFIFNDIAHNQIWMTDWSYGLRLFDERTKKIYTHNFNPEHNSLLQLMDKKGLFYILIDHNKNTWISSSRPEFYRYNSSTKKITSYSLSAITTDQKNKNNDATLLVNCFFEDNHHTLWLGTKNSGLLMYNKEKDSFMPVTGQNETHESIQFNYDINCIFQDNEDNLWLGTDKGITIFNPYHQYFQSIFHEENNALSLPKNEIQECIETNNGDILAGTWGGGIAIYDNKWNYKKNIYFSSGPEEYNLLWSFIQNDDGTIWAGCQHGYIHIYDPVRETIKTIHPPEANNFTIRCMAKDASGNILMGLHNGTIIKWVKANNKFYQYNNGVLYTQLLLSPVLTIYIDGNNNCWAGTENGFKKFDVEKMIYTDSYYNNKNDSSTISSNIVQCIDDVNDSTLAIGTRYGGLNFFNKRTKRFTHLSTGSDLQANTVNNLKHDAQKNIWLTTDYNLYKYIPSKKRFIHYNIEPGIINSSFTPGNFYCLRNGKWLALTTTEIISFNTDSLQKQEANDLQVDIAGFKIFDKNIFIDSLLYDNKPVKLSYRQNFISIEYGALNFSQLQETKYHYMMSGVDKDWVDARRQTHCQLYEPSTGRIYF